MRRRRPQQGFSLAFLDIMSCGLGAIILVFMLVRPEQEESVTQDDALKAQIAQLAQQAADLEDAIAKMDAVTADRREKIQAVSRNLSANEQAMSAVEQEKTALVEDLKKIREAIEQAPPAETADVLETPGVGEENYLIGLRVKGPRVLILVDSSASMTHHALLDIIRIKNADETTRQRAPKWQRTLRVARWLLARVPKSSQVSIITFNDKATELGPGPWVNGSDASGMKALATALSSVVPSGPTNLQVALEEARRKNPSDIYLITDGLPTEGTSNYKSLNPFNDCNSLIGSSSKISGPCRVRLFLQTLKDSALATTKTVNTILLPLEGDPGAAQLFWAWSSSTGGMMISPAEDWP